MHLHRKRVGVVEGKVNLREVFGKRLRTGEIIVVGENTVAGEFQVRNHLQHVACVLRCADAVRADHSDWFIFYVPNRRFRLNIRGFVVRPSLFLLSLHRRAESAV